MYEDKKYSINWLKIFVTVIIGFLVILLSVKLVTLIFKNQSEKESNKTLETNLKVMNDAAKSYFNKDNLPVKVGDTVKISLKDLIDAGKISAIKDKDGKECNANDSYIEVTRLDTEYQIKSYLTCENEEDYLNTFMDDVEKMIIITPETTTTTKAQETTTTKKVVKTTKATTKATQPAVKTYTVAFNSNGGDFIDAVTVNEGTVVSLPTPVRTGYTFVGWYTNGVRYDNAPVNRDIVLVAKWTK